MTPTVVKITDVTNPSSPQLVTSLSLGLASAIDSHEVVVRNNRLYVASKNPGTTSTDGMVSHLRRCRIPPVRCFLRRFLIGASTHTAMPTDDGKTLIVAEERSNGNVKIYDISMIDSTERSAESRPYGNAQCVERVPSYGTCISMPIVRTMCTCTAICCFFPGTKPDCRCSTSPIRPIQSYVGAFDTSGPATSTNFNGNWGVDLSLGLNRVLLSDRKRGLIVVDATGVAHSGRLQPGHGRRRR